jgi:hypothetical protein
MQVYGQLGSLDERKVDETFQRLVPKLGDCVAEGARRIEFLAGRVKVSVRIDMQGRVKWTYLSESSIGDRDTEKCMLAAVKSASWPPPLEGEGEAEKAFDFDLSPDVRDAVAWDAADVRKQIQGAHGRLVQCVRAARGVYRATVYVDTGGSVLGAGVAVPDERADGAADCVVDVIKSVKFPSPGSWPAKVTFDVP